MADVAEMQGKYQISSEWEVKLSGGEVVTGKVYCLDPVSKVLVLQNANHEMNMVSVASIQESKEIKAASSADVEGITKEITHSKKVLEDREKRALKLAQESLKHLNPKATPKGQMIFDRLLKACNEVVWKDESIIVLHTIKVDPPYQQENCALLQEGSGSGSLDRVQKIVAAANATN